MGLDGLLFNYQGIYNCSKYLFISVLKINMMFQEIVKKLIYSMFVCMKMDFKKFMVSCRGAR